MRPKRYRKKPVIVEALQWTGDNAKDFLRWHFSTLFEFITVGRDVTLRIKTPEGDMTASVGDYVIKGVKGELYPCKPDIFKETYEEVEEDE